MPVDKSWMQLGRSMPQYFEGVQSFLNYAYKKIKSADEKIFCPCVKCCNMRRLIRSEVHEHLLYKGIKKDYSPWYHHGENDDSDSEIYSESESEESYRDNDGTPFDLYDDMEDLIGEVLQQDPNADASKFYELLKNAETPLYPDCENYSNLSFVINLLHIKSVGTMTNKAFDMLLDLLRKAYPMSADLPTSNYKAKQMIKELGLHYKKIDACKNDCVIYYKELADATECPTCKLSRWKPNAGNKKKIPWKILRYFPLTPRLQRLYMSSKTAADMRWHSTKRVKDGVLRHPADAEAWQTFDRIHEPFGSEGRNVRLGLATDGFNPFGNFNLNHSTWPVLVFPYNLPPWMCMKEPYIFMSLLIPGPKGPGNDIDVYLRPLIDELQTLWEVGAETYDISTKQNFQMRAALLWTINDFPAYGMLSGWSTHGRLCCPCCASKTPNERLEHGSKQAHMCHRRFLPSDDPLRRSKKYGNREDEIAPQRPSGQDVVNELEELPKIIHGKLHQKQIPGFGETHNWKKHSIFFQLPYWKTLLLRHNLDAMHIEKNAFENLVGTIMNIVGKTKDSLNARLDLKDRNLRPKEHPRWEDGKQVYDPAPFNLSQDDVKAVCQWLLKIKFPDGYCGNASRWVSATEKTISGMKSHDCHVFLERLLPLIARELLPKEVCEAVIELSYYFKELCAKVLKVSDLELLEKQIVVTLCKLETIFPPAFFTPMIHVSIHLAWEVKIAGPVQYRWMYPIERYLHKLNTYVRNKARPEGSIAEGYLANECITFCSRYLNQVETKFNRIERNDDGDQTSTDPTKLSVFSLPGKTVGKGKLRCMSDADLHAATHYVLTNCDECLPFVEEHKKFLSLHYGFNRVDELHRLHFAKWFCDKIKKLYEDGQVSSDLYSLSRGPGRQASYYQGYNIHGFKFHTVHYDETKKTQNSGVMVKGENQVDIPYYGTLTEIVELWYTNMNKVILFNCNWYDTENQKGYKVDRFGVISVNTKAKLKTNEPFVLAFQTTQVYYVEGIKPSVWNVAVDTKPRNCFEMPDDDEESEPYQQEVTQTSHAFATYNEEDNNHGEDDEEN